MERLKTLRTQPQTVTAANGTSNGGYPSNSIEDTRPLVANLNNLHRQIDMLDALLAGLEGRLDKVCPKHTSIGSAPSGNLQPPPPPICSHVTDMVVGGTEKVENMIYRVTSLIDSIEL